ncbi:toxin [Streptomyces libani subsp. rufus]|nr:toxin [Streptomyces libani subsp. rufus]
MREFDLSTAKWRKSSYSDGNGGSCVEVAHDFPGAARWRKSSYSDGNGGNCVEIADNFSVVPVRDSKNPDGPALVFPAAGWATFVDAVKNAHFADA